MRKVLATVGNFDGVHCGHRYLLECMKREAAVRGLTPLVLIPATHPRRLIDGCKERRLLTTVEERRRLIEAEGIEVQPLPFDAETRRLTSEQFLRKIRDEIGVKAFLTGFDNRFGSDRDSTFADYRRTGEALGIELLQAPQLPGAGSSAIRDLLRHGDVEEAARLLGRPYALSGKVVRGQGLGHTIGFATANLQPAADEQLIPATGVYATTVSGVPGHEGHELPAVTNIGRRPTVDTSGAVTIETHIPGISEPLYGSNLVLHFYHRLRDERKFPSLAALQTQLKADTTQALGCLKIKE